MGRLTVTSPIPFGDLLDFAGGFMMPRKAFVAMATRGQTAGFSDAAGLIAVAFLVPVGGGLEFCLSIRPHARVHMRELVRTAHLTLRAIAETGVAIHCHVMPGNVSGARMARLAGFQPDEESATLWRFGGVER